MYSLYNIAKANGAVVGKEDYLFDEGCIKAYSGNNFIGDSIVDYNVNNLVEVREELKKIGKDILFVIAPGKGSFYSEYIPDKFLKNMNNKTNYSSFVRAFKENNIEYLDFRASFIKNKSKSEYPLFPKCGIHWSKYGEYIASDSLIKHIEKFKGIDLPSIVLDSMVLSKKNLYEDYDLAYSMNLINEIKNATTMAYPYFHFETKLNEKPIKTLVIGDSFYWGLFNKSISHEIFDKGEFWYYNKQIYSWFENGTYLEDIDYSEKIKSHDLFILFFNESNLINFDYGFTKTLHDYFFNKNATNNNRTNWYVEKIKTNQEWLNQIKEEAKKTNRPLDQLIRENAMYMVRKEQEKN